MSLISELRDLEASDILFYVIFFLSTIAPGFLLLYYYKPDVVKEYDTLKMILFSISLTLPILFLNLLIATVAMSATMENQKDGDLKEALSLGCSFTFISYYIAVLIAYFYNLRFSKFIVMMIVLEILIMLLCVVCVILVKRGERRS